MISLNSLIPLCFPFPRFRVTTRGGGESCFPVVFLESRQSHRSGRWELKDCCCCYSWTGACPESLESLAPTSSSQQQHPNNAQQGIGGRGLKIPAKSSPNTQRAAEGGIWGWKRGSHPFPPWIMGINSWGGNEGSPGISWD